MIPLRTKLRLDVILPTLVFVLFIGLWYVVYWLVPTAFATPVETLGAFHVQVRSGAMPDALLEAIQPIVIGFVLAAVVGVLLGSAMGLNKRVEQSLDSFLYGTYVAPLPALVPAFIIWFGSGFTLRWFTVFLFALFPITINSLQGAKNRPSTLVDAAVSFEADRWFVFKHVILPHQASYVMAGLRLGIMRGIKGLVVVELLVSVTGFGRIISVWSASLQIEGVISVVIVLMLLGIAGTELLRRLEKRFVHWRHA